MKEEIPGAHVRVNGHTYVKKEYAGQSDGVGDTCRSVGKENAEERQNVGYCCGKAETNGAPPLERHYGEEILGQVADDAAGSHRPADFEEIISQNVALAETAVLDDFAQFHVVHDLEAQRCVSADCFIK